MKTKAEVGVMLGQAKEHQEPPEAGKGKEVFSARAFRGSLARQHLDCGLLVSGAICERERFCCLSHQVFAVVIWSGIPRKLI